jgi:hypothetical protein
MLQGFDDKLCSAVCALCWLLQVPSNAMQSRSSTYHQQGPTAMRRKTDEQRGGSSSSSTHSFPVMTALFESSSDKAQYALCVCCLFGHAGNQRVCIGIVLSCLAQLRPD